MRHRRRTSSSMPDMAMTEAETASMRAMLALETAAAAAGGERGDSFEEDGGAASRGGCMHGGGSSMGKRKGSWLLLQQQQQQQQMQVQGRATSFTPGMSIPGGFARAR
jgi:hypothetical protein